MRMFPRFRTSAPALWLPAAAATAAKTVKNRTAISSFFRMMWKIVNGALTAYAIYDIVKPDPKDQTEAAERVTDMVDSILSPPVVAVLSADIKDRTTVTRVIRTCALMDVADVNDDVVFQGLLLFALANYIEQGGAVMYQSDEDVIKSLAHESSLYISTFSSESGTVTADDVTDMYSSVVKGNPETISLWKFVLYFMRFMNDSDTKEAYDAAKSEIPVVLPSNNVVPEGGNLIRQEPSISNIRIN